MSRLRPFAYTTGVSAPNSVQLPGIIPPSGGNQGQSKQLQNLEQDIDPIPTVVNFVPKESIDASIQVRFLFGSPRRVANALL